MTLQLKTEDPEVLSGVYAGFDNLQRYKTAGDVSSLNRAVTAFQRAASLDPHYFPAVYYHAITQDLSGRSSMAVEYLNKIHAEIEEGLHRKRRIGKPSTLEAPEGELSRQILEEVRFNLGVAYYHVYTGDNIDKAIKWFEDVEASNYTARPIKLLAKVALAQAWAQKIIQRDVQNPNYIGPKEAFEKSEVLANSVRSALANADLEIDAETRNELTWRVDNALGCANMFRSDYLSKSHTTSTHILDTAVGRFEAADRLAPDNWAVVSNLGSAWMRLGYWRRVEERAPESSSKEAFEKGERYLIRVVEDLRKDYGFAYYELGRLHRLQLNFELAIKFFEKALEIPVTDRNVSD